MKRILFLTGSIAVFCILIMSFSACTISIEPLSYTVTVTNNALVQVRLEVYADTTTNNLLSSSVLDSGNTGNIAVPPNNFLRIRNIPGDVFARFPGPVEFWQITQALSCTVSIIGDVTF